MNVLANYIIKAAILINITRLKRETMELKFKVLKKDKQRNIHINNSYCLLWYFNLHLIMISRNEGRSTWPLQRPTSFLGLLTFIPCYSKESHFPLNNSTEKNSNLQ